MHFRMFLFLTCYIVKYVRKSTIYIPWHLVATTFIRMHCVCIYVRLKVEQNKIEN